MNIYNNSWNEQTTRTPILKIWREIQAREQLEDSSSGVQQDTPEDTSEQTVN